MREADDVQQPADGLDAPQEQPLFTAWMVEHVAALPSGKTEVPGRVKHRKVEGVPNRSPQNMPLE